MGGFYFLFSDYPLRMTRKSMILEHKFNKLGQKKLIIRFSGHFWQKQMRQAGIFFFVFFTHETGEGTFFLLHEPFKRTRFMKCIL